MSTDPKPETLIAEIEEQLHDSGDVVVAQSEVPRRVHHQALLRAVAGGVARGWW